MNGDVIITHMHHYRQALPCPSPRAGLFLRKVSAVLSVRACVKYLSASPSLTHLRKKHQTIISEMIESVAATENK